MNIGIRCSPLVRVGYALYLSAGVCCLLLPWLVWRYITDKLT